MSRGDMHFDLTRPCLACPFRTDVAPYLRPGRVQTLHREILDEEKTFTCHETIGKKEQHCAGALRFIEQVLGVHGHRLLRVAHALGLYRPGTVRQRPLPINRRGLLVASSGFRGPPSTTPTIG